MSLVHQHSSCYLKYCHINFKHLPESPGGLIIGTVWGAEGTEVAELEVLGDSGWRQCWFQGLVHSGHLFYHRASFPATRALPVTQDTKDRKWPKPSGQLDEQQASLCEEEDLCHQLWSLLQHTRTYTSTAWLLSSDFYAIWNAMCGQFAYQNTESLLKPFWWIFRA